MKERNTNREGGRESVCETEKGGRTVEEENKKKKRRERENCHKTSCQNKPLVENGN